MFKSVYYYNIIANKTFYLLTTTRTSRERLHRMQREEGFSIEQMPVNGR